MHAELLAHARLLTTLDPESPKQVNLRRAISAAYYSVFHLLAHEVSQALLPSPKHSSERLLLVRALSHDEVRNVSERIRKGENLPAFGTIKAPAQLREVAEHAYELQGARNTADYDPSKTYTLTETVAYVERAERTFAAWAEIRHHDDARLFLALLLTRRNLQSRER